MPRDAPPLLGLTAYDFFAPPRIVFGWGRRAEIGSLAKSLGKRAFVVSGSRTLDSNGILDDLCRSLQAAGVAVERLTTQTREPEVADVDAAVARLREIGRRDDDLIIAIGGGSAIDLAKAVAALVTRAVHTDNPSHPGSSYEMLTGVLHPLGKGRDDVVDSRSDFPTYSSIIKRFKSAPPGIPSAVVIPEPIFNVPFYPGQHGGFLGSRWDPWRLTCDPSENEFKIPELAWQDGVSDVRLAARTGLLSHVDPKANTSRGDRTWATYITDSQQAMDLLGGRRARVALDLNREPPQLRDRYGRHKFGQGCLLARRLVEAGVPLVQVNWHRDKDDDTPMWDAHWKLEDNMKRKLMPPMDQAYPVLLDDLEQRGLLSETLVIWMGEFGRTPKLEYVAPHSTVGRNHWGNVFSIALAGAGVRGGQVFGSSDKDGAYPRDFAVEPGDLLATLFHSLGIDPQSEIHDPLNRPHPISRGRVLGRVF